MDSHEFDLEYLQYQFYYLSVIVCISGLDGFSPLSKLSGKQKLLLICRYIKN